MPRSRSAGFTLIEVLVALAVIALGLTAVIKALGVSTAVELDDSEYDNLFIVSTGATPSLVRLHFH